MSRAEFDNAPVVELPASSVAKEVQFVYPYYENPRFLERQIRVWERYSARVLDHLRITVVDDGSPSRSAASVFRKVGKVPFRVRVFRIEVDVRWNWLAARNVGMYHAQAGWCLLTDMDHVVDAGTVERLVACEHDPDVIYRMSRKEHTGESIHPHPNTMFMTREMFWRVGGYDENLSGFYGTDGDWRRRCAASATVLTLSDAVYRYEYIEDSSTVRYLRKQREDAGKKAIIALRRLGWKPKVLSFPYHEELDLC